uniref:SFRICE_030839 n=1 Tax=Spodoptera frugiperda TaxID=7108 RepID=A0A2H1WKB2_SPOFR
MAIGPPTLHGTDNTNGDNTGSDLESWLPLAVNVLTVRWRRQFAENARCDDVSLAPGRRLSDALSLTVTLNSSKHVEVMGSVDGNRREITLVLYFVMDLECSSTTTRDNLMLPPFRGASPKTGGCHNPVAQQASI